MINVQVPASGTETNENRRQLIDAISNALSAATTAAGLENVLSARLTGNQLSLVRIDGRRDSAAGLEAVAVDSYTEQTVGMSVGLLSRYAYGGSQGLGSLLPSEGDYLAILIDALAGDDHIIVGPTVTRSVWSDGGAGNDTIEHLSGTPILIDQTDVRSNGVGNGSVKTAHDLGDIATGTLPAPERTNVLFDV